MPESNAMIGYGTGVAIKRAAATAFVDVAEVLDIGLPDEQVDTIDVTHYKSPNRTREFIVGLTDPGEATISCAFIPGNDSDDLIRAIRGTRERVTIRVTFPNGVTFDFSAFVTGYAPTAPIQDRMTADLTLKCTGPITVTKPGA